LTDFDFDLARIDGEIAALTRDGAAPADGQAATRIAYHLYQRGSLTGDFAELQRAGDAIRRALGQVGNPADLYFLKANVDFKFHRLASVRDDLAASADLRASPQGRALHADLAFQEGKYEQARHAYEALAREDPSWDNLARLAHFRFRMGDIAEAERLYVAAEDELTAKEMRHFAWLELQRGLLDLSRGRFEDARAHYERADRAYSGDWLVEEHMSEVLGATGRLDDAIALYGKVIARAPRPEFFQALGELYEFAGEPGRAQPWHERALAAYLDSARRGEVHYYHHLADFWSDVRADGAEAVRWARRDVALRDNFATRAALAWALYREALVAEARDVMEMALSSGATDARLFARAAVIYRAAGDEGKADSYSRVAAEINPHHTAFHVHR
jgi:tetratricopeptide (TPR) repeat protein